MALEHNLSFSNLQEIRSRGFSGFLPIAALQESKCVDIPDAPGVYLILRPSPATPHFLVESNAGWFKGRNPTVPQSALKKKWVPDALVLYVGKAGGKSHANLRTRLNAYMRFGQGKPVGHWGGRYIWQLHGYKRLLVCWKPVIEVLPRVAEREYIREFESAFGTLPFANLRC